MTQVYNPCVFISILHTSFVLLLEIMGSVKNRNTNNELLRGKQ